MVAAAFMPIVAANAAAAAAVMRVRAARLRLRHSAAGNRPIRIQSGQHAQMALADSVSAGAGAAAGVGAELLTWQQGEGGGEVHEMQST